MRLVYPCFFLCFSIVYLLCFVGKKRNKVIYVDKYHSMSIRIVYFSNQWSFTTCHWGCAFIWCVDWMTHTCCNTVSSSWSTFSWQWMIRSGWRTLKSNVGRLYNQNRSNLYRPTKEFNLRMNLPGAGLEFRCGWPVVIRSISFRWISRSLVSVSEEAAKSLTLVDRFPGVTMRKGDVDRSQVSLLSMDKDGRPFGVFVLDCLRICWRCFSCFCQTLYGQ